MAGEFILAADFGTTGVKAALVNHSMVVRHQTQAPYPLALGESGKAEQDPADWWHGLGQAVSALAMEAGSLKGRVAAISFCAQFCGVVCTGEDGMPLRPALIWLDKRASAEALRLAGGFPKILGYNVAKIPVWLKLANGAPSHNGMDPVCKMIWLRDHEPQIWSQTRLLLDVKDWLILQATGNASTTGDSANLTWMMDTRSGREGWSPRLARMAGIPLELLPPIVDGASVVGGLRPAAAVDLGLDAGIPVLAGVSDVTAAALGSGAVEDGELHACVGTSSWIAGFFPRRILSPAHSFATIDSGLGHRPLLVATQETAGSALDWIAALTGNGERPSAPVKTDDPLFVPWMAGERVPLDDHRMRGSFVGLALYHDADAMVRSAAEGVAFNTRWAHDCVVKKLGIDRPETPLPLVGGGALNRQLTQMLADALERPMCLGRNRLAGVSGAAAIGASAISWYSDPWAAARVIAADGGEIVAPDPAGVAMARSRRAKLERLRPALIRHYRMSGD